MRILRIFLRGFNGNYCEAPIPEGASMQAVLNAFKMDGVLSTEIAGMVPWAVHWDAWAFMCILNVPDNQPAQKGPLAWDMSPPDAPAKPN